MCFYYWLKWKSYTNFCITLIEWWKKQKKEEESSVFWLFCVYIICMRILYLYEILINVIHLIIKVTQKWRISPSSISIQSKNLIFQKQQILQQFLHFLYLSYIFIFHITISQYIFIFRIRKYINMKWQIWE